MALPCTGAVLGPGVLRSWRWWQWGDVGNLVWLWQVLPWVMREHLATLTSHGCKGSLG